MSKEFIAETAQIKRAISLINNLDNAKFPLLIQRIVQKLHTAAESSFRPEELDKLESTFELSGEDCQLCIDILEFIYLQAAYELIKANVLHAHLCQLRVSEEKASFICELWQEKGKEVIEKIRQTKTIAVRRLLGVKWRLSLNLASDLRTRQKLPMALFELSLEGGNRGDEKVQVEFGREALYEFYGQLEVIQKQIDALNGWRKKEEILFFLKLFSVY